MTPSSFWLYSTQTSPQQIDIVELGQYTVATSLAGNTRL